MLFHKDNPDKEIVTYYEQSFYQPRSKDLLQHEMLFGLGDIYENFEERVRNWIAVSQKIDSVLELLRRAVTSSGLFLELKFLNLAQAIETYPPPQTGRLCFAKRRAKNPNKRDC